MLLKKTIPSIRGPFDQIMCIKMVDIADIPNCLIRQVEVNVLAFTKKKLNIWNLGKIQNSKYF